MLKVEIEGKVVTATLARPEVRNAINDELIAALSDLFTGEAMKARVVVLQGEGKAFCAGGDLEWMRRAANYTEQQNIEDALKLATLFESICTCPAAVIAKVHGAAFGGGSGLVAACDIAIASDDSLFAFSEVKLGLVAATISPFVIAKIGGGHARALFISGEAFGAQRAKEVGLVQEVVPGAELDETVEAKVKLILKNGPQAVTMSKGIAVNPMKSKQETAKLLARARASEEGKEGVAAFLEKRKASFVVER